MIHLLDRVRWSPHWRAKNRALLVTVDVTDFKVYRRRGRHAIPRLTPNAS